MTLNGITLDNDMYWVDEFTFTPTAGNAERTIDGHMVVQYFTTTSGRPMTLVGNPDSGWQSRTTVALLQALADTPWAPITVVLPDTREFTAYLRVEESPVMSFTPITVASAPAADFWYYGTINLRLA